MYVLERAVALPVAPIASASRGFPVRWRTVIELWAHRLFVARQLERIFSFRARVVAETFPA